jgi:hypothetical protein
MRGANPHRLTESRAECVTVVELTDQQNLEMFDGLTAIVDATWKAPKFARAAEPAILPSPALSI